MLVLMVGSFWCIVVAIDAHPQWLLTIAIGVSSATGYRLYSHGVISQLTSIH